MAVKFLSLRFLNSTDGFKFLRVESRRCVSLFLLLRRKGTPAPQPWVGRNHTVSQHTDDSKTVLHAPSFPYSGSNPRDPLIQQKTNADFVLRKMKWSGWGTETKVGQVSQLLPSLHQQRTNDKFSSRVLSFQTLLRFIASLLPWQTKPLTESYLFLISLCVLQFLFFFLFAVFVVCVCLCMCVRVFTLHFLFPGVSRISKASAVGKSPACKSQSMGCF